MGAHIVVDAFWGDAGKGKFSAYLSVLHDAAICVRAGIGPNAGHSIYQGERVTKARMVPLGFINRKTKLMIGSGVAVDPRILKAEIKATDTEGRVFVDYRCPIIEGRHLTTERNDPVMIAIDSTKSGSGAARADYVMRRAKRAKEVSSLRPYLLDVAKACNHAAQSGQVIIEGSQATYLSLYLSDRYPFTSSDNCTTAAFLDDVGLNWQFVEEVVLLVKCLPTAVGEGPLPNEMSEREIKRRGLEEFGVNTGRPRRRVRKIDNGLLRYAVMLNGATALALTYCDQYDRGMQGVRTRADITPKLVRLIASVERSTGIPVRYLDTGKDLRDIVRIP